MGVMCVALTVIPVLLSCMYMCFFFVHGNVVKALLSRTCWCATLMGNGGGWWDWVLGGGGNGFGTAIVWNRTVVVVVGRKMGLHYIYRSGLFFVFNNNHFLFVHSFDGVILLVVSCY